MDLADVRIKEHFGLVTNDTSTSQLGFLVSPPKNRETIEKYNIICFNHPKYGEACQVLAEVKEITSYEEVAGSTIGDRVGKMLATAKVLGYIDLRNESHPLRKLLLPPNPGSRVYMPYASFLEDAFKRGTDGKSYTQPLYLGKAEIFAASQQSNDEKIGSYLDAADLTSKHTLICGVDGVGKTHLATVIIEELASKTGYPTVVLDPNNEYPTLLSASNFGTNYPVNFQTEIVKADAKAGTEEITKKVKHGQITIITAETLSDTEKSAYYSNIINALAQHKKEKTIQASFLLVVEDAENLPLQPILEVLGSNGIATVLVTGHLTALGGRVLSKMGTQIAGRTIDPQDLAFLKNVMEGSDEQLSSLAVGEWVVNGLNIVRPMKIRVREGSVNQNKYLRGET